MRLQGVLLRGGAGVVGFGLAREVGFAGGGARGLPCHRHRLLLVALTALLACGVVSSRASAATLYRGYVTNAKSDTVTPINLATNTAGTPIPVGGFPVGVAITPNGETAYVANDEGATVTPITVATNTAGTPIPVGDGPEGVAITPNGETAYVTNSGSDTVTPITVATNTAGTPIPVGEAPDGIAITPNGETAYVTNFFGNTVTPIDLATNTAGTPIPVGERPEGVAITPNGETAYVTNGGSDTVTPITLATNTAGTPIPVGAESFGVAITPNGETAYVTKFFTNTVTPITVATNTAGTLIPVGTGPYGVAITPNGETAYVTNGRSDTVTPITVATNTAGTPIPVGEFPVEIAITTLNVVATCSGDSGTLTLSPGLTDTPAVQTMKIKGTLTGCTGDPFTESKYTATLKTTGPVSCSVLTEAGEPATGAAKYKWTPTAKPSKGTLSMPLTETPDIAFSGQLMTGSYSPLTLTGATTESYSGGATCGGKVGKKAAKAVKKGTFRGSAVSFE